MIGSGLLNTAFSYSQYTKILRDSLEVYVDFGNRVSYIPRKSNIKSITTFGWPGGVSTYNSSSGYAYEPFPWADDINNGYLDLSESPNTGFGYTDFLYSDPPYSGLRNNWTLEFWTRPNGAITLQSESTSGTAGLSGQKYLAYPPFRNDPDAGAGISLGTNGIQYYEHANGYLPCLGSAATSISSTDFSQIVVVCENKQPKFYVNGSFVDSGLTSARSGDIHAPNLFGWFNYGDFTGDIAVFLLYNKVLSPSEISSNFEAYRGRFGV